MAVLAVEHTGVAVLAVMLEMAAMVDQDLLVVVQRQAAHNTATTIM